jgi:hypothetical protein
MLWGLGSLAMSCDDPVLDARIDALGPEVAGVLPGALHRPGQPCLLCHASGGRAPRFTIAGTLFRTPYAQLPVGGVEVRLIDATRRGFIAYSNCAGNFFVSAAEYEPVLPMWVSLVKADLHIDMESAMNKDGDCGFCHQGDKNQTSAGHVFLTDDAMLDSGPSSSCGGSAP